MLARRRALTRSGISFFTMSNFSEVGQRGLIPLMKVLITFLNRRGYCATLNKRIEQKIKMCQHIEAKSFCPMSQTQIRRQRLL